MLSRYADERSNAFQITQRRFSGIARTVKSYALTITIPYSSRYRRNDARQDVLRTGMLTSANML